MPLSILPIVVPVNYGSYGPAVDTSGLRGEKTILLNGSFDGLILVYGSHNGTNFAPVFSFMGARPQSIKQIFNSSYRFIVLRCLARDMVAVNASISGEFSAVANSFAALPVVPLGAYGAQATVDLFTLVPPDGLFEGTNLILTGDFVGSISIEGSLDGLRFSPVASFKNLSRPTLGSGSQTTIPEHSPYPYTQQVRYLRVNVLNGTFVNGPLTITIGGENESVADSATFLAEPVTNAAGSALLAGEVVRITGNEAVGRAQSNLVGNVNGLVGVMLHDTPLGDIDDVVNAGKGFVLLEAGLTPLPGDPLWVSAVTAGRSTNITPVIRAYMGVIKDASIYAATGGVIADINPGFTVVTAAPETLAQSYSVGVAAADQTLILTDLNGGALIINATTPPPLYTGVTSFEINVIGGSMNFYRRGGFDVSSAFTRTAALGMAWDEVAFLSSTLTISGGTIPAITSLSMVKFEAGIITATNPQTIGAAATVTITDSPSASNAGGASPTIKTGIGLLVNRGVPGTSILGDSYARSAIVTQADTTTGGNLNHVGIGNAASGIGINYFRTRSVDGNTPATLQNGDHVVDHSFWVDNGSGWSWASAAYWNVLMDGVVTPTSTPGRFAFYTTPIGSISSSERMRISNAGEVMIATTAVTALANSKLVVKADATVTVPAAGTLWNGFELQASTLSLAAGGVAPTALSAAHFAAPTITGPAPGYTLPFVSTVRIDAPVAAGAITIQAGVPLSVFGGGITGTGLYSALSGGYTNALYVQVDPSVMDGVAVGAMGNHAFGSSYTFFKSRSVDGTTEASVQNGDILGFLAFTGDTAVGGWYNVAAAVQCRVDGVPSPGSLLGRLVFTTSDGPFPVERMRISGAGTVMVATTAVTALTNSKLVVKADATVAVPAAGTLWNGFEFQASTLSLAAGGVAPSSLSLATFAAPTITSADAKVIPTSATVTITGTPIAAGGATLSARTNLLLLEGITNTSLMSAVGLSGLKMAQFTNIPYETVAALGNVPFGCVTNFLKSRSTDGVTPAIVLDNDVLGGWDYYVDDGTGFTSWAQPAALRIAMDGVVTAASTPGRFTFSTASIGSTAPTERMRINNAGTVLIATTTPTALANSKLVVKADATVAVPAAGTLWNGFEMQASTFSLAAGGVAPTALSLATFAAPTITSADAKVIPTTATVTIAGAPIAAGGATLNGRYDLLTLQGITGTSLLGATGAWTSIVTQVDANVYWNQANVAVGNNPYGVSFNSYKTRSVDGNTPGGVQDNDTVFVHNFNVDNGLGFAPTYAQVGAISAAVDGVVSNASTPGRIVLFTTPSGGIGSYERMRINNAGTVLIATTTPTALANSKLVLKADATVSVPAAGTLWNGFDFQSSTLTIGAGGTIPSALSLAYFAVSIITSATVYPAVPVASTVTIAGAPANGGAISVSMPLALWIQDGSVGVFKGITGTGLLGASLGNSFGEIVQVDTGTYYNVMYMGAGANATGPQVTLAKSRTADGNTSVIVQNGDELGRLAFQGDNGGSVLLNGAVIRTVVDGAPAVGGMPGKIELQTTPAASIVPLTHVTLTSTGNLLVGVTADVASSKFRVQADKTITAAGGAIWNGVEFVASTLTITGATTPITTMCFFNVAGPTISAASAVVTTDFYTQRIGVASFIGVGPASATRNWSLYVEGNLRLDAGITEHGVDINAAGPYNVLPTDDLLQVRYTATGIITINLPALTGGAVLNGRRIRIKDSGYNAAANPITIAVGNGADQIEMAGAGVGYTQNVSASCIWLVANTTTNNWEIV